MTLREYEVWDATTRVFHWLNVLCVLGLIAVGTVILNADALGANNDGKILLKTTHVWIRYVFVLNLLWRLVWGFVGGHWSRFGNFVPSRASLQAYVSDLLSGRHQPAIGHNPMGALSVLAMLVLLLVQVFTGFISDDEIASSGPWTPFVSGYWVELATEYHGDVGKVLLIVLVVLHVASVVFYKRVKNEDLVTPMIKGDKVLPDGTPHSTDHTISRVFALVLWAGCAYVVYLWVNLTP